MSGRNQEMWRPLLRKARKANFTIDKTGGGHLKITTPDGSIARYFPATPGSAKSSYMLKTFLRQQGVNV